VPLSLFALACLAGAELGQLSASVATHWPVPLIWPQVGIMVAALLLAERRRWIAFIIAFVISLVSMVAGHRLPVLPSVGLVHVSALEACWPPGSFGARSSLASHSGAPRTCGSLRSLQRRFHCWVACWLQACSPRQDINGQRS